MPAAGEFEHDPGRTGVERGLEQPGPVAEAGFQDRDEGKLGSGRHGDGLPARGRGPQDRPAFRDPAERRRRPKGAGGGGVGLLHPGGGVDQVVEGDEDALAAEGGIGGAGDGGMEVRGAVGAGKRRIAHRAGDDHGHVAPVEEVEEEARLLDRVGPLGDDDAGDPLRLVGADRGEKVEEKPGRDLRARDVGEVSGADVGEVARAGHGREQIRAGEAGRDPAAARIGHARDGSAERDHLDPGPPHARDPGRRPAKGERSRRRKPPPPFAPRISPSRITTSPRRMVVCGQPVTSKPSQGV